MTSSPGGREVGRLGMKILPDTSKFLPELRAWITRLEKNPDLKVELPTTLNFDTLYDDVRALHSIIEALEERPIRLDLDLDASDLGRDVSNASRYGQIVADLNKIKVELETITNPALRQINTALSQLQLIATVRKPIIRPEVDGTRATVQMTGLMARLQMVGAAAKSIGGPASEAGRNIALFGPLIFAAAIGIAAIAPAFLTLLPLLAAFGVSIGVILVSLKALKSTFEPLWKSLKGMGQAVGPALVAGLTPVVALMSDKFVPVLEQGLVAFAKSMNLGMKSLFGFLTSAEGLKLVGDFLTGLSKAIQPFMAWLAPLTEVLLRLSIQALPGLELMGDTILDITERFAEWLTVNDISDTITESMKYLGQLLAIIGGFLKTLFAPLFTAAPGTIAMLTGMVDVFGALIAGMMPAFEWMSRNAEIMRILGGVLLGVAVAVGLVLAGGIVIAAVFGSTATIIAMLVGAFVGLFLVLKKDGKSLGGPFVEFLDTLKPIIAVIKSNVMATFETLKKVFGEIGDTVKSQLLPALTKFMPVIEPVAKFLINMFGGAVRGAIEGIGNVIKGLIGVLSGLLNFITSVFTGDWSGAWDALKQIFSGALQAILGLITAWLNLGVLKIFGLAFTGIKTVVLGGWTFIKNMFTAGVSGVNTVLIKIFQFLTWPFRAGFSAVRGYVSTGWAYIRGAFSGGVGSAKAILGRIIEVITYPFRAGFAAMKSAITTGISTAKTKFSELATGIKNFIKSPGEFLKNIGKDIINGLINGIKNKFGGVKTTLSDLTQKIKDWKGPKSVDKRLLVPNAHWVIDGFITGIGDREHDVERKFADLTKSLSLTPALGIDPILSDLVNGTIDLSREGERVLFQMTDWESGKGVMRRVSEDVYAGEAAIASTNALLGVS